MKDKDALFISIIDEDPFCRTLYQQHLHNLGYKNVELYRDGQECLDGLPKLSNTDIPDIIFLDYCLEKNNGLEVLKKIKRFNPDIYLVFLTVEVDRQIAADALKLGAFDYIIKGENDFGKISQVLRKILAVMALLKQGPTDPLSKLLTMFGVL